MAQTEYRKEEYKKVQIPFGFNTEGNPTFLPMFHTFFVANTGHGKTKGMQALLSRFHKEHPDWRILILDVKDKRDFAYLNADIPITFLDTTDPLDLKALLEPLVGGGMMFYLDKIIEESTFDTLTEIHASIAKKVIDADAKKIKISPKDLSKLRVLGHLLGKLVALVERPNVTKELKLKEGFNVMPISLSDVKNPNLKKAFQQLIVRSVLVLLLGDPELERTLIVLDECHKFSPQKYGSICKQPISEYISEGRGSDKIVWLADQALTKIDKEPLKSVKVWVVGQQLEKNEVDDAMETVNSITELSFNEKEIKNLRMGEFIVVNGLKRTVEKAYLQPENVPNELAIKIAKGEEPPEAAEPYIREIEMQAISKKTVGEDDEVYKEKYEEQCELNKKLTQTIEDNKKESEKAIGELKTENKELAEKVGKVGELNGIIEKQGKILEQNEATMEKTNQHVGELEKELGGYRKLGEALTIIMGPQLQAMIKELPVAVATSNVAPTSAPAGINTAEVDQRIMQIIKEKPAGIEIVTIDLSAKAKEIIKTNRMQVIEAKFKALSPTTKKAALFVYNKKEASVREIYEYVYEKEPPNKIAGAFYINVTNPIEDAGMTQNSDGKVRWTLPTMLQTIFGDEAANIEKYLVSLLLP